MWLELKLSRLLCFCNSDVVTEVVDRKGGKCEVFLIKQLI